ncbi:MAG: helix-turn-helix domain-containing protein [Gammaproteobacteria bacterium]
MIYANPLQSESPALRIAQSQAGPLQAGPRQTAASASLAAFEPALKERRTLKRGDHLFLAGDSFHSLYAVYSGSVKMFTVSDEGEAIVFGFYLPGDVIGPEAIDKRVHGFSAVALETSSIGQINYQRLQALSQRTNTLQQLLTQLYQRELARECALLLLKSKKSADGRMASFLLDLSTRYAKRGYSPQEFNISMSRTEIGDYLGLASETISRIFGRFQDEALVRIQRRHVQILDQTRLVMLAGLSTTVEQQP